MTFPDSSSWIVCPVVLPLIGGLLCFLLRHRNFALSLTVVFLSLSSVVILAGNYLTTGPFRYEIGGWSAPLGIALRLDGPALLMLCLTAVTGLGITLYAEGYFSFRIGSKKQTLKHQQQEQFFWPLWLMLLASINALFLSADIFNLYVTLELISVSATAMASLSGKPASQIAAFRYLLVSLLGSLTYLLGVLFLYKTYGVLDISMLASLATAEPGLKTGLILMSLGLMIKSALFPLHFWLPPAHANALAPVSAILSGLVIKTSFYLMFRLWLEVFQPVITPPVLEIIGLLGAGAILWGAAQAIRQQRLKLMIAYSTVSQIGYLFIAFPLVYHQEKTMAWMAVLITALAHGCAKSAMFMSAGSIFLHVGHDRIRDLAGLRSALPVTVFAFATAAVNLMGLPPSGGFIGKWLLLTASLSQAQYRFAPVIMMGSILASVYVFRVISRLFVAREDFSLKRDRGKPLLLEWPALVLAVLSLALGIGSSLIFETLNLTFSFSSSPNFIQDLIS